MSRARELARCGTPPSPPAPSRWRVTSIRALPCATRRRRRWPAATMKTMVSTSAKVPNAFELDRHRVEEDDLDVEEDEQHRDQVEADPEAEALLDLGGQAALVRVDGRWRAAALGPMQELSTRRPGRGSCRARRRRSRGGRTGAPWLSCTTACAGLLLSGIQCHRRTRCSYPEQRRRRAPKRPSRRSPGARCAARARAARRVGQRLDVGAPLEAALGAAPCRPREPQLLGEERHAERHEPVDRGAAPAGPRRAQQDAAVDAPASTTSAWPARSSGQNARGVGAPPPAPGAVQRPAAALTAISATPSAMWNAGHAR